MTSILNKLKKKTGKDDGIMVALGGLRLAGKTTLAGTLPGKTIVIQPTGLESGSTAVKTLAENNGFELDIVETESPEQMFELLKDEALQEYDNVFVDGVSAFTEQVSKTAKFQKLKDANTWDAFRYLSEQVADLVMELKSFASVHQKTVFVTYALKAKYDAEGNLSSIDIDAQGMSVKNVIEGKSPNVIVAYAQEDEDGNLKRKIITQNKGPFVARIGNILDSDNPGLVEPDLAEVLKLIRK